MALLVIDGVEFNNLYMVKESYIVTAEKEILDEYKDANGRIHVSQSNNTTYEINFNTPYLDQIGLTYIRDMITSKSVVNVKFYDTNTDTFVTGDFNVHNLRQSNLHRWSASKKMYKPISIRLYGFTKIA